MQDDSCSDSGEEHFDHDGENELGEFVPHPVEIEELYPCVICDFVIVNKGDSFVTHEHTGKIGKDADLKPSESTTSFCPAYFSLTNAGKKLLEHLMLEHSLVIADNEKIAHLPSYLEYWKEMLKGKPIQEYASTISTKPNESSPAKNYFLISDILPEDKKIREELRTKRLNYLLNKQNEERHDTHFHRKCLFCKKEFDDRKALFSHMYQIHSFNIGLPDNLVNVHHILNILQKKVNSYTCVFCEKVFKNFAVLKSHMRKKKHFKLDKKNKLYDTFYIINYLEEGKNWEVLQTEDSDESDGEESTGFSDAERAREDQWDEWNDDEGSSETKCLYCPSVFPTSEAALEHCKTAHNVDLLKSQQELGLDFYSSVKMINYIRKQIKNNSCPNCQESFASAELLNNHLADQKHFGVRKEDASWRDDEYLIPVLESDPLLQIVQMGDDDDMPTIESEEIDMEKLTVNQDLLRECM